MMITRNDVLQYSSHPLGSDSHVLSTDTTLDLLPFLLARSIKGPDLKTTGSGGKPTLTFLKLFIRIYNCIVPFMKDT